MNLDERIAKCLNMCLTGARAKLSPAILDAQAHVQIHQWLEIGSQATLLLGDDIETAFQWLKMGLDSGAMVVDSLGRIWQHSTDGSKYYPLHFEGNDHRLYGYKITMKIVN